MKAPGPNWSTKLIKILVNLSLAYILIYLASVFPSDQLSSEVAVVSMPRRSSALLTAIPCFSQRIVTGHSRRVGFSIVIREKTAVLKKKKKKGRGSFRKLKFFKVVSPKWTSQKSNNIFIFYIYLNTNMLNLL